MFSLIAFAAVVVFILATPDPTFTVWPLPKTVDISGGEMELSKNFQIKTSSKSDILLDSIKRYTDIIGTGSATSQSVDELTIEITTENEDLNIDTYYNYSLTVVDYKAVITAHSIYGGIYGLETFSQLIYNNKFNYSKIIIQDEPNYNHRGIMADTGRRFIPFTTVKLLLDSMQYNKLNVLHLHLSDWCRVAVESKVYPMLTKDLVGLQEGFYTQDQIKELVAYAKYRGIRIIPEFDIPGHSKGWGPLSEVGMQFCDDRKFQLYGDPENKTLNVLKTFLREIAPLFPDEIIHFGCDELSKTGVCNADNFAQLEKYVFDFVYTELGKRPAGWEEILYSTKIATNYSVVSNWQHHTATESTLNGYDSIENHGPNFYLNHYDYLVQWVNISTVKPAYLRNTNLGVTPGRLYGGEFSMWTDYYCYISQCGTASGKPVAYQLYGPEYNKEFEESFLSMIYPRGIKAAGAFWRYDGSYSEGSEEFKMKIRSHNDRLRRRNILTCPDGCLCNELTKCGEPYIKNHNI